MEQHLWKHVQSIKSKTPLVHSMTNYVVMNNTANALLAAGASPIGAMLALGSAKKYDPNNPMFTPMNFNMPTRNNPYNSSFQPKDVNVKVKVDIDEQGNWKGAVQNIADSAVMDAEDQRIQQALNSFHGGGY